MPDYKGPFLRFCEAIGINSNTDIPDAIDCMFRAGPVFAEVVFAALGYDYIFNPSPDKLLGLYQLFINTGPHNPEALELNVDSATSKRAQNCFFDPQASYRPERSGGVAQAGTYGASEPIRKFRPGGAGDLWRTSYTVADYNLCVQALDVLGDCLMKGDSASGSGAAFHKEILAQLKKGRGKKMDSMSKQEMVECYNKLLFFWSDRELTGMGFKAR